MSWKQTTLGDVADIVSGATPKSDTLSYWDGPIAWATPTDLSQLNGKHLSKTIRTISEHGLNACSARLLPPRSVLFSSRAPIGLVAINTKPMATNQGFKSFVPKPELNADFLFWWLKSNRKQLQDLGNGATFKEVSKAVVARVPFLLPPLSEQLRIAAILDKADTICRKYETAIAQIDQFSTAGFEALSASYQNELIDMKISELAEKGQNTFSNGPFGSNLLTSELTDIGVPVVYIRDIRNGRYDRVSAVFVTEDKAEELRACSVRAGDVLIAKVGDPPGIAAVYPDGEPDAIVTQDVIRLRLNRQCAEPEYIQYLLNSEYGKHVISSITVEATRARFSLGQLKKTKFEILPLEQQRMFGRMAKFARAVRTTLKAAHEQAIALQASLNQRAFRGEL